ncbi:hypothetical protein ACPA2M_08010 [Ectopseudomonas chengduensis]
MANPYIHNSVLTREQALDLLQCYARFIAPTAAAARCGVSRQTASALYLKLSQRLHEKHSRHHTADDDASRIRTAHNQAEVKDAYARYLHGSTLDEYRRAREGRMLVPDEYGPALVAQELKRHWGKLSEKAFLYHYALIKRTAEYRIDWMHLLGVGDMSSPSVALGASNQIFRDLEASLKKEPLSTKKNKNEE